MDCNLASWCGCVGMVTPDECSVCGPDDEISDEDLQIDDNFTCGSHAEFYRHFTICPDYEPLKAACGGCVSEANKNVFVRSGKKKTAKKKEGKKMR